MAVVVEWKERRRKEEGKKVRKEMMETKEVRKLETTYFDIVGPQRHKYG